jgi:hypothetical protein
LGAGDIFAGWQEGYKLTLRVRVRGERERPGDNRGADWPRCAQGERQADEDTGASYWLATGVNYVAANGAVVRLRRRRRELCRRDGQIAQQRYE